MKKLLVVLLASMMVFALAAASFGAVNTIKGDFRFNFMANTNQNATVEDYFTDNVDLRIIFDSKISDSFAAHLQMRAKAGSEPKVLAASEVGDFYADEYWFDYKTSFATFRMGNWDLKLHPSRVLIKAAGNNIFPRSQSTLLMVVPITDAFYAGIGYVIDGSGDGKVLDGAYDFQVGYKGESWGIEAHSYNTKYKTWSADKFRTGVALDAYWKATDNVKLYLFYHDPKSYQDTNPKADTVIGGLFTNLFDTKAQVSVEYSLLNQVGDFHNYGVQAVYPFKMGLQLEYEIYNSAYFPSNNQLTQVLRLRAKF